MQGFLDQLAILWENARLAPNGIDAEKLQNVMMLQVMIVAHFIQQHRKDSQCFLYCDADYPVELIDDILMAQSTACHCHGHACHRKSCFADEP